MSQERRRRAPPEPWNLTKHGSYGVFATADSIPIEYLQTTFGPDELNNLVLARDVRIEALDFEMLMQRDLDEDRAEKALTKYLSPRGTDQAKPGKHSVFFPPLLIACLPSERNKILLHYPNEERSVEGEGKETKLIRRWGEMFQLNFFTGDPVDPYELRILDAYTPIDVDTSDVEAKFRVSHDHGRGVKLIAIDGQHRLWALKHLARDAGDVVSKLVVPVCILFSTSASEAAAKYYAQQGVKDLPNVPQTFRKVFVDVNSRAESVGAHTTILLDDMNVGSLVVREFCDRVNKSKKYGLSSVEWNVKNSKDARQLTRGHSITSVGIIEKALSECFGKYPVIMSRLLDIEDAQVHEELDAAADDPDSKKIEWTKFSIAQRKILAQRVNKGIVNVLYEVFFESDSYKQAYEHYERRIQEFEQGAKANQDNSVVYRQACDAVLDRFSMPKMPKEAEALIKVRKMGKEEKEWRESNLCPVMDLALFQRAILLTLRELIRTLPDAGIQVIGKALVELLNLAMDHKRGLFHPTKAYTRMTIWQDLEKVVNQEKTRKQMSRLLLSVLGGSRTLPQVVEMLDLDEEEKAPVTGKLMKLGEGSAGEYWDQYVRDRLRHFKRSYQTNLGLTEEELEELDAAHKLQEAERERIIAKELSEEQALYPFDAIVKKKLADEFERAEEELRKVLGFDKGKRIVGSKAETEDNGDYE